MPSPSLSSSETLSQAPFPTSSNEPPPGPSSSPTSAPPIASRLTAVRFVDRDHGWLGLSDGLLGTSDGGLTWTRQLSGKSIGHLWAYDASHAWALTTGSVLYRTDDGTNWQAAGQNDSFTEVQFITPEIGWGVVPQTPPTPIGRPVQLAASVLQTVDGGITWHTVSAQSIWSICFIDERNGWGADGKQIYKTTDAGRNWTRIVDLAINDEGPWYPTVRCADGMSARVQITEPKAALSHAPYLMFRTNDGGTRWLLEYREPYTLGTTTPWNTPQLGSYPSMFDTLANGSTWLVTCTPPIDRQDFLVLSRTGAELARGTVPFASCVVDATFVDARHGWIIGPEFRGDRTENVLSRTTDNAQTWTRVYPP